MLPASDLTEIFTNLSALRLDPTIAAAVLGALAPLLRSSEDLQRNPRPTRKRAGRPRARRAPRRKYKRRAPRDARERAIAALRANPDATTTRIAKIAKVSRSTAVNARKRLAGEMHKEARRKPRGKAKPDAKTERRERAQQFLKEALAHGPKPATDVEAAAARAHIDDVLLTQARAALGVRATRPNAGSTLAVQWSLPG